MKTAFGIFWHDLKALVRNPFALIVVFGLIVLSAVFAWCSIAAMWNPYAHVGSMKVAVVNNDKGASIEGIPGVNAAALAKKLDGQTQLNAGDLLEEALANDESLNWQIVDSVQGDAGLGSGEYVAEFVIPETFSQEFLNVLSGSTERPMVEYWVNGKYSAVTTEGASANVDVVGSMTNRVFSAVAATSLSDLVKNMAGNLLSAGNTGSSAMKTGIDGAQRDIDTVSKLLAQVTGDIDKWHTTAGSTGDSLDKLKESIPALQSSLDAAEKTLGEARTSAMETESAFASAESSGIQDLPKSMDQIAQRVNQAVTDISTKQATVDEALAKAKKSVEENDRIIAALRKADPESKTLVDLEKQNKQLQEEVQSLETASKTVSETAKKANEDVTAVTADVTNTVNQLKNNTFSSDTFPKVETSLDSLAILLGSLKGSVASLSAQVDQAKTLLTQLDSVLQKTKDSLATTTESINAAAESIGNTRTDLTALANSTSVKKIMDITEIDAKSYGEFMADPVQAEVTQAYPLDSYGAGVAPFYTTLAIWLGCLMLIAVLKLEIRPTQFLGIRSWQGYVGRLLLLAALAIVLGIVVTVGEIIMGVHMVGPVSFIVAGAVAALCFACVIFALAITFKHVGKALALVLLVIQIPGAAGMFPAQLMPEGFQVLHPWFPFTYSMDAMREGIGGFYGLDYVVCLLWLIVAGLVAVALALLVRRRVSGLNALFDRKLEYADVFIAGEQGMGQGFGDYSPRDQAVGAMFESGESRVMLMRRAESFMSRYAILRQATPIVIVALTIALGVVSMVISPDAQAKLIMLVVLLAVVVFLFCMCVAYEFRYDNLKIQMEQAGMHTGGFRADRVVLEPERVYADAPGADKPETGELETGAVQETTLNEIDVSSISWDDPWASTPVIANVEDDSSEIEGEAVEGDAEVENDPEVEEDAEVEEEVADVEEGADA